jgi:hypothetical protein
MANDEQLARFLKEEGQAEPAVVTYDGFVVNGNRRVCILRRESVEYMDIVILPQCQLKEIYELELALQMAPETKAEYNWVDGLLSIREGLETYQEDPRRIAARMRTNAEHVLRLRKRLAVVDEYLAFMGKPGAYHLVPEDSEQSFIDLQDHLESHSQELTDDERAFYRDATFVSISGGAYYRNLRKLWKAFRTNPLRFCESCISNAADIDVGEAEERPPASTTGDELLDELARDVPEALVQDDRLAEARKLVGKMKLSPRALTEILDNVRDDIESEQAHRELATRPIEALRSARRALESVDLRASASSGLDHAGLAQILGLIDDIAAVLVQLRTGARRLSRKQ